MPVILDNDEIDMWLDVEKYKYEELLKSKIFAKDKSVIKNLEFSKLGPMVNNIKNKTVKCLMSFDDYQKE